MDESSVIGCLEPLTKNKRNVLLHPVINTFIMMKYNSYAALFCTILLFKMIYAVSLSGLALTTMDVNASDCFGDEGNKTETPVKDDPIPSDPSSWFWAWSVLAGVMTLIRVAQEVVEMIILRTKWLNLRNIFDLFHTVSAFAYIFLAQGESSSYCWMKYLVAWIVLAVWMDLTMSLRTLMFGKMSSLGLYILMLKEVLFLKQ